MSKDLWFKFYPSDWLGDLELRSVSLEARGLYIDMICFMHNADPYGYFVVTHESPTECLASRLLGVHMLTFRKCLKELLESGVLKRDEKGRVFSKRMRSDREKLEIAREHGRRGGNPSLLRQGVNPTVKEPLKLYTDTDKENKQKKATKNEALKTEFEAFWKRYPNKQGKQRAKDHFLYWRKKKTFADIENALTAFLSAKKKAGSNTFPNGSTWLNPNPRSDSANIGDYWQAPTCRDCALRSPEDGRCPVLGERVRNDRAACERFEGVAT